MQFTVHVEIPALDRLVNFLQAGEQGKIDALAAQIRSQVTDPLHTSTTALQDATTAAA